MTRRVVPGRVRGRISTGRLLADRCLDVPGLVPRQTWRTRRSRAEGGTLRVVFTALREATLECEEVFLWFVVFPASLTCRTLWTCKTKVGLGSPFGTETSPVLKAPCRPGKGTSTLRGPFLILFNLAFKKYERLKEFRHHWFEVPSVDLSFSGVYDSQDLEFVRYSVVGRQ